MGQSLCNIDFAGPEALLLRITTPGGVVSVCRYPFKLGLGGWHVWYERTDERFADTDNANALIVMVYAIHT